MRELSQHRHKLKLMNSTFTAVSLFTVTVGSLIMALLLPKGETIHCMYQNRDYFGNGSVHDTWRPLMIQTI